jgi:hypothetical protein
LLAQRLHHRVDSIAPAHAVEWIEGTVLAHADPAQRLANGVRLYLHKAKAFPLFARFIVQVGFGLASPANKIYANVPPHVEAGFAQGHFERMPMPVVLDVVSGSAIAAIAAIARMAPPNLPPEALAVRASQRVAAREGVLS